MESTEGTRARRAVPSRATERRAWGGAVGPRGRSVHGRSCSGGRRRTLLRAGLSAAAKVLDLKEVPGMRCHLLQRHGGPLFTGSS